LVLEQQRRQPPPVDRLGQKVGSAQGVTALGVVREGEQDHRRVRELGVGLEGRQDRPAVHVRQGQVQNDGRGAQPPRPPRPSPPPPSLATETCMPSLSRKRRINSRTWESSSMTRIGACSSGRRGAGDAGSITGGGGRSLTGTTAAGICTVKLDPLPIWLRTA